MTFEIAIKSILIGIAVSAPMGPMGILCLQRTINKGLLSGQISGLGISIGDTLYAAIAGYGLSFVADFFIDNQAILRIAGGILLIFLGYKIFNTNPAKELRQQLRRKKNNLIADFFSTLLLTLTNPLTIIFFMGVFAGMAVLEENSSFQATTFVIFFVFAGTIIWWVVLTTIINIFRDKITLRKIWWINKVTSTLIALLGVAAIISIFFIDKN